MRWVISHAISAVKSETAQFRSHTAKTRRNHALDLRLFLTILEFRSLISVARVNFGAFVT